MINPHYVYADIAPCGALDPVNVRQRLRQQLLGSEYLMTTAESLDRWKFRIKRRNAYRHRIGIIDHPCVRTILPDRPCNLPYHGNGTHRPKKSPRSGSIADRLVDAVFLRCMDVILHLVKSCRKNGNNDKIGSGQCLAYGLYRNIPPCASDFIAYHLIVPCRFKVYIVKKHTSRHIICLGEIVHQRPRPPP